jgi:hypothetical protein
LEKYNNSAQSGFAHILVLLAAVGVISFILISQSGSFKDRLFGTLFPKPSSFAAEESGSTVSTSSPMLLMGSNLGVWGMSNGVVNENFVNPYALSTDTNDLKEYSQPQLAKGVLGVLRFPTRETGVITDAGLQQVQDTIINAGAQPLITLESDNTEHDRMVTLVSTIFSKTTFFEFGNEDNYFSHDVDTEYKTGWTGAIYGTRWKQLVPRLRQARSDLKIGGPVVSHLGNPGDVNQPDNKYLLDFFNSIKGQTSVYPDYITYHLYNEHGESTDLTLAQLLDDVSSSTNPNDWGDRIDWVRNIAKQTLCYDTVTNQTDLCQNNIPMALTEWNWDAIPENNGGRVDNRDLDSTFIKTYSYAVLDMLRSHNVFMSAQYGYGADMGGNRLTMLSPWSGPEIKPQYYAFKDYVLEKGLNVTTGGNILIAPTPSPSTSVPIVDSTGGTLLSSVEAEVMSLPAGNGQIYDDWNASGKKGLLEWSNGTATTNVTVPSSNLVIRAKGDQCLGSPNMKVLIDGSQVYETTVSNSDYSDFAVPTSLSAGQHSIGITFDNDSSVIGICDKNLRLDVLNFITSATPTTAPTIAPTPVPTLTPSTPKPTAAPVVNSDVTAPTINLISPLDGAVVSKNTKITLSANATDNIGVNKVEFRVNGTVVGTVFQAPYRVDYKLPGKPNTVYTITATAFDAANNSQSQAITILAR